MADRNDIAQARKRDARPAPEPSAAPRGAGEAAIPARRLLDTRRSLVSGVFWLLLLVALLGAVTYAWFSSSRYTNVTPVAHTVSDSGYDLLIGASASGPFDTQTTLADVDKTLYPVSTVNLVDWWRAGFQNASGITTDYVNCSGSIDDYALTGSFYLKGSSVPLSVYLYQGQMSVANDPQLLAALRVGFIMQTASGTRTYIFTCDDLGDTSGATARRTTTESGVAVSGSGAWGLQADPALSIGGYTMDGSGDAPTARSGAQPLATLGVDEVARVDYFVYMEGCDENCIDEAQSRDITLRFAFAGTRA